MFEECDLTVLVLKLMLIALVSSHSWKPYTS